MSRIHACATAAAFLLTAPAIPALAGTPATVKLFNLPDVISSYAEAFCGHGSVAGTAITSDWVTTAFSYTMAGQVQLFSVPGSTYTAAHACYEGRFMGQTIVDDVRQGFAVLSDGSVQLVSPTDGTDASVSGTNSSGTLVGSYYPTSKAGLRSGFVLKNGVFAQYDAPSASDTEIVQIAEDGTLLGNYMSHQPLRSTGFIDRQGVIEKIKFPGSYNTFVTGMNANGQVVGYFTPSYGAARKGFVLLGGSYKAFALTSTGDTYAMGIDNKANVVGYYIDTVDYSSSSFIGKPRR